MDGTRWDRGDAADPRLTGRRRSWRCSRRELPLGGRAPGAVAESGALAFVPKDRFSARQRSRISLSGRARGLPSSDRYASTALDAAVDVGLPREPELQEDRMDHLLDRVLRDHERSARSRHSTFACALSPRRRLTLAGRGSASGDAPSSARPRRDERLDDLDVGDSSRRRRPPGSRRSELIESRAPRSFRRYARPAAPRSSSASA